MNFPIEFFEKEIRDDFEIAELMKRAWAAALEVVEVVDSICRKHNIRWFAEAGTMLGAVRHKGFIPWDDDIDICMLRPDYNRFIEIARTELPEGFVIAGMYADDKRLQAAAQVQQLRIIADEEYWNLPDYMSRFHGFPCFRIGIDIFPYDYVNRDKQVADKIYKQYYFMMNTLTHYDSYLKKNLLEEKIREIEGFFDISLARDDKIYNTLWKLSDELIAQTSETDSDAVTIYFFKCYRETEYMMKKEDFDSTLMMPFEFFEVPVPVGYDDILKVKYGDYMKLVKSYDTHSYPFYKNQAEELEKMLRESGVTCGLTEFCRNWDLMNRKCNN